MAVVLPALPEGKGPISVGPIAWLQFFFSCPGMKLAAILEAVLPAPPSLHALTPEGHGQLH